MKQRDHEQADLDGERADGPQHLGDLGPAVFGNQVRLHHVGHQVNQPKDGPHAQQPDQGIEHNQQRHQDYAVRFQQQQAQRKKATPAKRPRGRSRLRMVSAGNGQPRRAIDHRRQPASSQTVSRWHP